MKNEKIAVAIVGNFKYLKKYYKSFYKNIREKGNYKGEIVLITSLFCPTFLFRNIKFENKVVVLRFKKIHFSTLTKSRLSAIKIENRPNRFNTKKFQWHKLYLFHPKLKEWDYVFYLDINMSIHYDINPILQFKPINKIYARSDGYPDFKNTLRSQFDASMIEFYGLDKKFNLDTTSYFQTGILFYDTKLIDLKFIDNCLALTDKYPITITNEQGILNLHVIENKILFEELPIKFDNFISYFYWLIEGEKIIITKQLTKQYK